MFKIKNITLIIILLFFITSCNKYWYKPASYVLNNGPKKGSPGYLLGWNHGCQSGMATNFGGPLFLWLWDYKKDADLVRHDRDLEKLRVKYEKELPINWDDPEEVAKKYFRL